MTPKKYVLLCLSLTGTRVWDVVNELVGLCTMPPPDNPFSLDMCYLHTLPLPERFLATGALLNFLEMIVVQGNRKETFYDLGGCHAGYSELAETGFTVNEIRAVD